jgi:hypothetical protein
VATLDSGTHLLPGTESAFMRVKMDEEGNRFPFSEMSEGWREGKAFFPLFSISLWSLHKQLQLLQL